MFQGLLSQIQDGLADLPLRSKITMGIMFVVVITAFILVISWLNKPDYRVLYSSLASEDAGKVVEYLQEQNVKYKYDHAGSTIMVPSNRVYDMRLQLANAGIPNDGVIGYEIFDENNFGMTEYVQQVNYKRALEGELQRTVQQMNEVEAARVHLVLPKEAIFKEDQGEPTAAVILKLKSHSRLDNSQIEGIQYLVANSVENLEAQSVSILDASGNLLTETGSDREGVSQATTQYSNQKKIEEYLSQKAQSMLDGVLGYGRSIVRVTADINFEQIQKTEEIYDPDSQVIRSEERIESASMGVDTSSSQQEHLITNYEMNKTVQSVMNEVGDIKRLHVAVLIDGTYQEGEDGERHYQPREQQELQRLERIVKAAVGFNQPRGDQFEISNLQFDLSDYEQQEEQFAVMQRRQFWENLLNKGLSVGLVVFFLFLLRNVVKRSKVIIGEMPFQSSRPRKYSSSSGASQKQFTKKKRRDLPDFEIEMDDEVLEKTQMQEAIRNYSEENPQQVTSLIRSWLVEE
ncbi:MAG: flagellar M-ring protein FliF [Candidatus Marinimicrobia bacterium]|nr:flagellar M-ring protein FliF [Candidatus Neomarinimicrobiota bacterium]MCF7880497.1 flagellar M-ring protein FliF [Candidatus Neomarinimicrobiota bacterium]